MRKIGGFVEKMILLKTSEYYSYCINLNPIVINSINNEEII